MYSEAYEKPGVIICPTCFAPLYPRKTTKVMTCKYCGSLLILRNGRGYTVKKDDGWYWFSSQKLREGISGIVITDKHTVEFGENGEIYVDGSAEIPENLGIVKYIWGEIPVMAVPGKVLEIGGI